MTIARDFDYVRPRSVADAVGALARPGARLLAGGTDVVPWLRDGLIAPDLLVDIKAIPDLAHISVDDGRLEIGALATFSDLIDSALVGSLAPMLIEMASHVASGGVRNRATLVGNLCSAVPSLDAGPALMVFDTWLLVTGPEGDRRISIDDWFVGPRCTRIASGEIVTGASLALPSTEHAGAFLKLSRYSGEDLAQANLAIRVSADLEYRLAFGAVAATPVRARGVEALLDGHELDESQVQAACDLVVDEIAPITDIRATASYRTHMCRVMLRRGLWAATQRLAGAGPPYPTDLI
jgi:carbon-monoxide dehydrogenase medium subunit